MQNLDRQKSIQNFRLQNLKHVWSQVFQIRDIQPKYKKQHTQNQNVVSRLEYNLILPHPNAAGL